MNIFTFRLKNLNMFEICLEKATNFIIRKLECADSYFSDEVHMLEKLTFNILILLSMYLTSKLFYKVV